jgi:hypothetical protein
MAINFFWLPQKRANENVLVVSMLVIKIFWYPQGFVMKKFDWHALFLVIKVQGLNFFNRHKVHKDRNESSFG